MHDALLRSCERERQVVVVEGVEHCPHLIKNIAFIFAAVVGGVTQDVELEEEQLLKLQSEPCVLQLLGVVRVVNAAQGLVARHKVQRSGDERRQRLVDGLLYLVEHGLHDLFQGA